MSLYDDDDDVVKIKESKVAGWSQVRTKVETIQRM